MKEMLDGFVDMTEDFNRELGWTAGRLWHYLNNNGNTPLEVLAENHKEIFTPEFSRLLSRKINPRVGIYMVVGWLMREDKLIICIDPSTKARCVRLLH